MKKLIPIAILLICLFFYRTELTEYAHFIFTAEEEPFEWVKSRANDLYPDLPQMEFDTAIVSLHDFEEEIQQSLANLEREAENDDTRSYRRRLQCELAVLYRQTASKYLQGGDDDNYLVYMEKTREQVQLCTNLKNIEP